MFIINNYVMTYNIMLSKKLNSIPRLVLIIKYDYYILTNNIIVAINVLFKLLIITHDRGRFFLLIFSF